MKDLLLNQAEAVVGCARLLVRTMNLVHTLTTGHGSCVSNVLDSFFCRWYIGLEKKERVRIRLEPIPIDGRANWCVIGSAPVVSLSIKANMG